MVFCAIIQLLHFHGDGDAGVWIGLTDQEREDHWRWASGILHYNLYTSRSIINGVCS